jgi:Clp amino terminal domain, pathogenicity island component
MFQRFTDRARRVVVLAQEEARSLNHNHIGTEHILLGLIQAEEGVAAAALQSVGITLDAARHKVEEAVGQGQQAPSGHIPFTPPAKKVLELSLREALQLGHEYIGTEHILLGLISQGDGVGAQVLVGLGADLNRVRQQAIQLIAGRQGEPVAGEGPWQGQWARAGLPDDVLARMASLDRRLAAIERWLGMRPDLDDLDQQIALARREKEAAIERQDFEVAAAGRDKEKQLLAARAAKDKEWAEAGAARPSLASEFGQVNAELARLRAILREHGIDPGDHAA